MHSLFLPFLRLFAVSLLGAAALAAQTALLPAAKVLPCGATTYSTLVTGEGSWTATCTESWVSFVRGSQVGTGTVDVVVAANDSAEDRTAVIRIGSLAQSLVQRGKLTVLSELRAVGSDEWGQLGDNTVLPASPIRIMGGIRTVVASRNFTLILKTDGTLWSVGENYEGQLGDGTQTNRAHPVLVSSDVASVAAGGYHALFVKTDGTLWGMGRSQGLGVSGASVLSPVLMASGVQSAAAGLYFSVFVKTDGTLWGVGSNFFGQLGVGTTTDQTAPIQVPGVTGVKAVSAGYFHTVFVKTDGSLWGMGRNLDYELGDGTSTNRSTPVSIASDVLSVAAGRDYTLLVKTDGSLWSCGVNAADGGWFGNGQRPAQVMGGVVSVSASEGVSMVVKTDGTLWSTGYNQCGQLGCGSWVTQESWVQIASGVRAVSAGWFHSCFIKTDDSLWAAGASDQGQLGNGLLPYRAEPVQVENDVRAVAAGDGYSLFLKQDGTLLAVGKNDQGQLGDGTMIPRSTPVVVATSVAQISAAGSTSLFVRTDGTLWGMGANGWGQLGEQTVPTTSPVQIASGVRSVANGSAHTLFVKTDDTLWSMGANSYGQLGDGTTSMYRSIPQQVGTQVRAVAAGFSHSLILGTDGILWAVGCNSNGQLGDGTTTDRTTPVRVNVGAGVVEEIAAGSFFSLYRTADGMLRGMGNNFYGQLGLKNPTVVTAPAVLADSVKLFSAGAISTLIVRQDGSLSGLGLPNSTADQRIDGGVRAVAVGNTHWLYARDPRPPVLTVAPVGRTLPLGESTTLDVGVVGPDLQYKWYQGESGDTSMLMSGASGSVFTTQPLYSWTRYWVNVSNAFGSVSSPTVLVKVDGGRRLFADWMSEQTSLPPSQRGPGDTPASDGIPNLLKYAFGVAPMEDATALLPRPTLSDGGRFFLDFRLSRLVKELRYSLEVSDDLAVWTETTGKLTIIGTEPGAIDLVRFTETAAGSNSGHRFIRLKVEQVN